MTSVFSFINRMDATEKIKRELKPQKFDRARAGKFSLERAKGSLASRSVIERVLNVDAEKRTVDFAFASNKPIEHWFGFLILDTGQESVVLDRVLNGVCPHLVNHDPDKQVGVLLSDSVELGTEVRGKVKFSRSKYGDEIFQDVVDEIRNGVSFGFLVHDMVLESDTDGVPTYRATKWEILETTSASIPADISVGMGRELYYSQETEDFEDRELEEKEEEKREAESAEGLEERSSEAGETQETRANSDDEEDMTEEEKKAAERSAATTRMQEFKEIGEYFGEPELARDFELQGKTVVEFRAAIVEKRAAKQSEIPNKPVIEFSKKEAKEYSLARAILADANIRDGQQVSSFEAEVSEQLRRSLNIPGVQLRGGILIPTNVGMQLNRAGLDTASATKGQTTVYTEFGGSLIELLRAKAMVMLLGATVLPGLQGNVSFPRQNGAASVSWVGENPGSDVGESNLTLDSVALSPKTLQATTSYSRQLLAQSSIDIDSIVANDLAQVNALAIDKAALHGTGSSFQPQGIYAASGVNSVAFGGSVAFSKLVDMETEIAVDNADFGTMAYLTTPGVKGKAKQTAELSNTINNAIWRGGEMNGYRAEASNQVAKNLGAGTNEHGIILAVWSELLVGEWGAMEIITDPYRLKKQGMIEVTTFNMVDIARRHDEAFCKGTGLVP